MDDLTLADIPRFEPADWWSVFTRRKVPRSEGGPTPTSARDYLLRLGFIALEGNFYVITDKYRDYMYKNE